jgi:acyl-coenzyme A synthetase/AMP-(fatty) acid ligase
MVALLGGTALGSSREALRDRCVLLATQEQFGTAVALLELDGLARRIVLCTPDLQPAQLADVASSAGADAIVVDSARDLASLPALDRYLLSAELEPAAPPSRRLGETEWVLLTSGTTARPKLVAHTLDSLAGALIGSMPPPVSSAAIVWSTFYDIRRYGGLQIYLRAVLTGAPLVLSSPGEAPDEFLARAAAAGVTHISGTPSHWRRALMSGAAGVLAPRYVRLSGEVADQAVLDSLRAAFPQARVAHAFASTEAGVAFDVDDGLAGFPAEFLSGERAGVTLKVEGGTLRIRSSRNAARYLGDALAPLQGDDGFVDTGDLVELKAGRYYFRGRRGGVINVGGLKVFPEEVESVLNADPRVRMSLVRARRSPITGAVVVADVVLSDLDQTDSGEVIKQELLTACRSSLAAHKVPVMLRLVPALELSAAGKLVRPGA